MKTHIVIFLSVIVLVCMLSACQATPTQEIIQGKDESLLETIQEDSKNIASDIKALDGEIWVDEISIPSEEVQVFIDATIHTQKVDEYPVIRVKSSETGMVAFENALDYFLTGTEIYYWTEYTKEDIEGKLFELNKELSLSTDDGRTDWLEKQIDYYTAKYKSAPNIADDIPFKIADDPNGDVYRSITGSEGITIKAYLDNGLLAGIDSEKDWLYYGLIESNNVYSEDTESSEESKLKSISMDIEEATQIASASVESIIPNTMKLVRVAAINKGQRYMDMEDIKAISPECLVFYFTRSYDDVETTYAQEVVYFSPDDESNYEDASKDPNYRPGVVQEYIRIVVDDLKIVDWFWVAPKEEVEVIIQNVAILSFGKIKDIFAQQAVNKFAYECEAVINREIKIEKIVLGMMVIGEKDNNEGKLSVPVWDFIGTQRVNYLVDGMETTSDVSFMTINAIDGSIIDRELGY